MPDCLFCAIAAGRTSCRQVYEDQEILAFRDLNPQAPVHILVIPKQHIPSLADLSAENTALMGRLAIVASEVARNLGLAQRGFRLVLNCGTDACQTVPHLHLHLLGGRTLGWPPG